MTARDPVTVNLEPPFGEHVGDDVRSWGGDLGHGASGELRGSSVPGVKEFRVLASVYAEHMVQEDVEGTGNKCCCCWVRKVSRS